LPTSSRSSKALAWIVQIAEKSWADDLVLAGLVRAM